MTGATAAVTVVGSSGNNRGGNSYNDGGKRGPSGPMTGATTTGAKGDQVDL